MIAQCCKLDVVRQCVDVVLVTILDLPSLSVYARFSSCQHCRGSVSWKIFWCENIFQDLMV